MKRGEAIGLLKDIICEQLIQPSLVVLEPKSPDDFQLYIKGNYNFLQVEKVAQNRFTLKESKGYLVFDKP